MFCTHSFVFQSHFSCLLPFPAHLPEVFLTASWISCYFLPEQCSALHGGKMGGRVSTWVRGWACHAGLCALSPPCCAAAESTEQFPQHCPDQTACLAQAQSSNPYIADRVGMYASLTCLCTGQSRCNSTEPSGLICSHARVMDIPKVRPVSRSETTR